MLTVGDRFENPETGAWMEIVRAPGDGEDAIEVRRLIKPGNGKTTPHYHRDYVERFVVEEGTATVKIDGALSTVSAGEESVMQMGAKHINAYNDSGDDLILRHSFEPASDFAKGYVATLGSLMLEAKTDGNGEVPLPAAFAIANATASQTFAAGPPTLLQSRVVFPLGALIAKLRGYELQLPN